MRFRQRTRIFAAGLLLCGGCAGAGAVPGGGADSVPAGASQAGDGGASITALEGAAAPSAESVRRLLRLTGAREQMSAAMDTMIQGYGELGMDTDELAAMREDANVEDLIDRVVPIWQKHLTQEDVDALLAFHESPAGRRFVEKQPLLMQECMRAGMEWGRALAERHFGDFESEAPTIIAQPPPPPPPSDERPDVQFGDDDGD